MNDQQNGQNKPPQLFNPNEHLMQFERRAKQKDGAWITVQSDYLPVAWRLVWFRECCPQGTIDIYEMEVNTEKEVEEEVSVYNKNTRQTDKVIKRGRGYARYKAIITDGKGGRATGTKSETVIGFPDYIEKAETGAIGRALAGLGYGTQFAPDLADGAGPVDSPVSSSTRPTNPSAAASSTETEPEEALITEQQQESAIKLYGFLKRGVPDNLSEMSYVTAQKLIKQLTADYREYRTRQGKPVQLEPVVRMINTAKQRCESLGVNWEDAKTDAKIATPDDQLIVEEVVAINKALNQYEENKKVKTKAS